MSRDIPRPLSAGWHKVQNQNAAAIPTRGVMRVTGMTKLADGDVAFTVDQPNVYGDVGICLINGPTPIGATGAVNQYGRATRTGIIVGLYDTGDGSPAYGDNWGPRNGTWMLKKDTAGFFCLGPPTNFTTGLALFSTAPIVTFLGKNLTGSIIKAGTSGNLTVLSGGSVGSESSTGLTLSVFCRSNDCNPNDIVRCIVTHDVASASPKFETLNTGGSGAQFKEGKLASALAANGSATGNVYTVVAGNFVWDGSTTVLIRDRSGWSGQIGQYFRAVQINGEWRPDEIGC